MSNPTTRVAMDLYKGEALRLARQAGTDRFGNSNLGLGRLLELTPQYNADLMTSAFYALCLAGEWPGSKSTRGRYRSRGGAL